MNNSGFTSYDDDYDYESDDAEAVVYLISRSGKLKNTALYVMKRIDAVTFCERPETDSNNVIMSWAYCFTTHRREWREELDTFRKDDGRFTALLDELGIKPIYTGGGPVLNTALIDKMHKFKPQIQKLYDQINLFETYLTEF